MMLNDTKNFRLSANISNSFFDVQCDIDENLYSEYWFKGGRGSTKSTFISIQILLGMIRDSNANAIVFRRYSNEIRDTVYSQFQWTLAKMGLLEEFDFYVSPPHIVSKKTGQQIIFKGADKPGKLKSIKLAKGYIKYAWFEELDQFAGTWEIRNILQSVFRGEGKQIVFYSYNPPKSHRSWVNTECAMPKACKKTHHSTYLDVPHEWLGETFLAAAEHLKATNFAAYRHEYLGEEIGTGFEIFNNIILRKITDEEIATFENIRQGLDWGYAVDPVCFERVNFDRKRKILYLFYEFSGTGVSNVRLAEHLQQYAKFTTIADSAEPKSIAEMKAYGFNIKPSKKGQGSVESGIKFLQSMEQIVIDPVRCPLAAKEFVNYTVALNRDGTPQSQPIDKDNHSVDSVRYCMFDDIPSAMSNTSAERLASILCK